MIEFETLCNKYEPISLAEMESVSLLKRVDNKFIIHQNQLLQILNNLSTDYKLLEIDGKRIMTYRTLYFDTKKNKFYFDHHNGKPKRTKIRIRKYVDSDLYFLEIKIKDGRGNTIKSRKPISEFENNISETYSNFIEKVTQKKYDLIPALWNRFNRFTLVNVEEKERITIDLNLSFESENKSIELENLAIIEVKQERFDVNSKIVKSLRKFGINPIGLSKYCVGMIKLNKNLKYNAFKPKLLKIKKITS